MEEKRMVIFDSDDAAQYRTNLTGWVSRHGHFWGTDERAARYDGCTHTRCEDCGEPVDRGRLICPNCHETRQVKRYAAMPKEEWNEVGMLWSEATDKYFSSWEEVDEYCEEEDIGIDKMRLVICDEQYLSLLSEDYGCDELAEDGELPDSVIEAIEKFNEVIKNAGPVSWYPGKKAVLPPTPAAEIKEGLMKFRKKLVIIEAIQWHPTPETWEKIKELQGEVENPYKMIVWYIVRGTLNIPTLEGNMTAEDGDWIIKGIKGEFYPCKPDIFEQTYEPVESTQQE